MENKVTEEEVLKSFLESTNWLDRLIFIPMLLSLSDDARKRLITKVTELRNKKRDTYDG